MKDYGEALSDKKGKVLEVRKPGDGKSKGGDKYFPDPTSVVKAGQFNKISCEE